MILEDTYGRVADYLRIGVTDRCNLRCRYCMPAEGIDFAQRHDILSYEEIIYLSRIFRKLGVSKVRLTGGEPFVRKDIQVLLRNLIDIFPQVHVTTNATLLHEHIDLLHELPLYGLNISLDSLDRNRFLMITRRDSYGTVMSNIMSCKDANIPMKINMVVMKGVNDMEVVDFVQFGIDHDIQIRFIEAMPFNDDDGNRDVFLSAEDIAADIKKAYPSMSLQSTMTASSSLIYSIDDKHEVGIIPAYTRSLCGMCNRIRLTPKGEFITCLYAVKGLSLLSMIRDKKNDEAAIIAAIRNAVTKKRKNGYEEEALRDQNVFNSMTTIGG